jgi:hypothetical protein
MGIAIDLVMKRAIVFGILLLGGAVVASADESGFTQQLSPGDFAAAGLNKLSPDELARLDRLVQGFRSAAAAAQASAEARERQAEADAKAARAAQAAAEKKAQGFLAKTRGLLLPGAQIEYQPLESRVVGPVRGWEAGTIFRLENGQRWQVEKNTTDYYGDTVQNPKARIVPAPISGFKIEIEGFPPVRVRLVGQ